MSARIFRINSCNVTLAVVAMLPFLTASPALAQNAASANADCTQWINAKTGTPVPSSALVPRGAKLDLPDLNHASAPPVKSSPEYPEIPDFPGVDYVRVPCPSPAPAKPSVPYSGPATAPPSPANQPKPPPTQSVPVNRTATYSGTGHNGKDVPPCHCEIYADQMKAANAQYTRDLLNKGTSSTTLEQDKAEAQRAQDALSVCLSHPCNSGAVPMPPAAKMVAPAQLIRIQPAN